MIIISRFMILSQEAGNDVTHWLSNLGEPTVLTLCLGGAGIIFFVTRQILAVQKNVANQYIAENTKLRSQNDEYEADIRALRASEREAHLRNLALERQVSELKTRLGE
jgi:hypothetical protein